MSWAIHQGDALEVLQTLPDRSVHCCVTSPPYWRLRDYLVDGQIGLEDTIEDYLGQDRLFLSSQDNFSTIRANTCVYKGAFGCV